MVPPGNLGPVWSIRRTRVATAAVFAANALFRLPLLGEASIAGDEDFSIFFSQQPVDAILRWCRIDTNPPLYHLLLAGWIRLFGIGEVAVRAPSLLLGAAAGAVLFRLAWRRLGLEAALLASALYLASSVQLYYAHEARAMTLVVLLAALSLALFIDVVEAHRTRDVLLLGLVNALLLYSHYTAAFLHVAELAAALPLLLRGREGRAGFARFAASQAAALVLFAPWARYPLLRSGGVGGAPPDGEAVRWLLGVLAGSPGLGVLIPAVLVLGLAGVARGARLGRLRGPPRHLGLFVAAAVVPVLLAALVSRRVNVFLPRYVLYATLGVYLALAHACSILPWPRLLRVAPVSLVVALAAASLDWHTYKGEDWRGLVARLRAEPPPDAIVFGPEWECMTFAYYWDRDIYRDYGRFRERMRARGAHCVDGPGDQLRAAADDRRLLLLAWWGEPAPVASALGPAWSLALVSDHGNARLWRLTRR